MLLLGVLVSYKPHNHTTPLSSLPLASHHKPLGVSLMQNFPKDSTKNRITKISVSSAKTLGVRGAPGCFLKAELKVHICSYEGKGFLDLLCSKVNE